MEEKIKDTDEMKQDFIRQFMENDSLLETASSKEKQEYKAYIEEGCQKVWPVAIEAKAYACYGGNSVYECDWETSRDCLLKLIELQGDDNPFAYNTLGYIYYYGRCNGGVPEYEKAAQYFMVGAAHGIYESRYKIADMMMSGKGLPQSKKAAVKLVCEMYDENYEIFCNEGFEGKFADVALRLGGYFERGEGTDVDYETALYHYMQAKYAIDLRMEEHNFYGDSKVRRNIDEAITRVKEHIPEEFYMKSIKMEAPSMLGHMLSKSVGLDVELSGDEDTGFYIKATRLCSEHTLANMLITIPEMNYCKFSNEIVLKIDNIDSLGGDACAFGPRKAYINEIRYNEDSMIWEFLCSNQVLISFGCDGFVFEG